MKIAVHDGDGDASDRAATTAGMRHVRANGSDGTLRAWCINSATSRRPTCIGMTLPRGDSSFMRGPRDAIQGLSVYAHRESAVKAGRMLPRAVGVVRES